jgi:hypothetical protein
MMWLEGEHTNYSCSMGTCEHEEIQLIVDHRPYIRIGTAWNVKYNRDIKELYYIKGIRAARTSFEFCFVLLTALRKRGWGCLLRS